ncbi:hypothetical protein KPH14_006944 [Odynerus spinipes]|uniref:Uncharacterized protein n=1 Tax=Odynerus spinipes TaxID=1348599 RepID=A0AAD9RRV9_9HYME|nr:hypothetical protein KPH14_006944 [Odynerus spinipes]
MVYKEGVPLQRGQVWGPIPLGLQRGFSPETVEVFLSAGPSRGWIFFLDGNDRSYRVQEDHELKSAVRESLIHHERSHYGSARNEDDETKHA